MVKSASPAKILVVEDEPLVAKDLTSILRRMGYSVTKTARSADQVLDSVREERPDLALMDIHLRGNVDGIDVASILVREHQVPVVFLTAYADDETLARASAVHALGYLVKPFKEAELRGAVRIALEKSRADRVVSARDAWLRRTLARFGETVIRSESQSERPEEPAVLAELRQLNSALQFAAEGIARVDLDGRYVYVNRAYAEEHGHAAEEILGKEWRSSIAEDDVARALEKFAAAPRGGKVTFECAGRRKDGATFFKHVTLVAAYEGTTLLGTYEFCTNITARRETEVALRDAMAELAKQHILLRELAVRDELTGCYNRREFNRLIQDEFRRAARHNRATSLMLVDLDHFKQVNDRYGHQAGDQVLKDIGQRIGNGIRLIDRVARYGGEEFAVILPETRASEARLVAERLRAQIAAEPVVARTLDGEPVSIALTASFGIAELGETVNDEAALVREADAALYSAKNSGRNCVRTARDDAAPA
ncbi:MAG TPA: diguanylate cyclase [Polyangiaceae bacterium]|nr:diguanylate cyclase [Polyangiaceae bacterium]